MRTRFAWIDQPVNLTYGSQFLLKGIVYQNHSRGESSRSDPLADDGIEDLRRDLEAFKELGLNTLFVCKCWLGCIEDNETEIDLKKSMLIIRKVIMQL